MTLLLVGDWKLAQLLEKYFPARKEPIRFISERKSVVLRPEEILYIESNDREVTVFGRVLYRRRRHASRLPKISGCRPEGPARNDLAFALLCPFARGHYRPSAFWISASSSSAVGLTARMIPSGSSRNNLA